MGRILIVDDEPGIRAFFGDTLRLAKHHVTLACDGIEAIAQLKKDSFDLLLCDLKMPRKNGMEVLAWVQKEQPNLRVLVISAHGTIDTAVEAMKQGAYDYIQKPLDSPKTLRVIVERALKYQTLERSQTAQRNTDTAPTLTWGAPSMVPIIKQVQRVAPLPTTIMLTGESGTGKEVFARAIHRQSARADGPFVAINCAAIVANLLESRLFGHERGAFTGADQKKQGQIELAHEGTCFLDELGELPLDMQSKLLRVLEERSFQRVGGTQSIHVDVRWIAATNRPLEEMVKAGTFRADLYHRLAVFPIHLPPLRSRTQDIIPLATALLNQLTQQLGQGKKTLATDAVDYLLKYGWPGNIRELRNALERAAIMSDSTIINASAFTSIENRDQIKLGPLKDIERDAIIRTMDATEGNRTKAAKILGIGVRTLYDKLKRYDLDTRWSR